jgi:hypothetical protein
MSRLSMCRNDVREIERGSRLAAEISGDRPLKGPGLRGGKGVTTGPRVSGDLGARVTTWRWPPVKPCWAVAGPRPLRSSVTSL